MAIKMHNSPGRLHELNMKGRAALFLRAFYSVHVWRWNNSIIQITESPFARWSYTREPCRLYQLRNGDKADGLFDRPMFIEESNGRHSVGRPAELYIWHVRFAPSLTRRCAIQMKKVMAAYKLHPLDTSRYHSHHRPL